MGLMGPRVWACSPPHPPWVLGRRQAVRPDSGDGEGLLSVLMESVETVDLFLRTAVNDLRKVGDLHLQKHVLWRLWRREVRDRVSKAVLTGGSCSFWCSRRPWVMGASLWSLPGLTWPPVRLAWPKGGPARQDSTRVRREAGGRAADGLIPHSPGIGASL